MTLITVITTLFMTPWRELLRIAERRQHRRVCMWDPAQADGCKATTQAVPCGVCGPHTQGR